MFTLSRTQQGRGSGLSGRHVHGTVVDNNDPEKLQRVKIRVPELHRGIKDEDLPWVGALVNTSSASSASTVGTVQVPQKGAKVWAQYTDETMLHGFYLGAVPQKDTRVTELTGESASEKTAREKEGKPAPTEDDDQKDYPDVVGSVDASGSKTVVNTKRDTFEYTHVSGTKVSIDGAGRMTVVVNDKKVGPNAKEKNAKGLTLTIIGDVNLTATQNVTLNAIKDFFLNVKGKFVAKIAKETEWHSDSYVLKTAQDPKAKPWVPTGDSPESPTVSDPGTIPSRSRPTVPDPTGKENS